MRTQMRAALRDDRFLDRCAAARARFAGTSIGMQEVLVRAGFAPGIAIIGERRATTLDRFGQDATNGVVQAIDIVVISTKRPCVADAVERSTRLRRHRYCPGQPRGFGRATVT